MTRNAPTPAASRPLLALALALCALAVLAPETAHARRTFTGENTVEVPRDFMAATQAGLEMIYRREYPQALDHFEKLGKERPDSAVGNLGRAVAFQSMMLENYDFAFADPYKREQKAGYAVVTRALKSTSQKAWNYFLYAALVGVDGIHDVRRGEYLVAFNKGWDAVEAMKRAIQVNSRFQDPQLGVGIYNYWRTAITRQVPSLPKFGDHRAEGIAGMKAAQEKGFLVWAAAGFALGYTYWEDRKPEAAIAEGLKLRQEYPDSVVNNMMLGRIYADVGQHDKALALYREIQADSPQNTRVQFLIADNWFRSKKHDKEAQEAFMKYLGTRPMAEYQAHTWYRLGQIRERTGDLEGAIGNYQMALSLHPKYPACEKRLAEAKKTKSKGGAPAKAAPAGGARVPAPAPKGGSQAVKAGVGK